MGRNIVNDCYGSDVNLPFVGDEYVAVESRAIELAKCAAVPSR